MIFAGQAGIPPLQQLARGIITQPSSWEPPSWEASSNEDGAGHKFVRVGLSLPGIERGEKL